MRRHLACNLLIAAGVALATASAIEMQDSAFALPVVVETERGAPLGCSISLRATVLLDGLPHSEVSIVEQEVDSIGIAIVVTRGGAFSDLAHRIANGLVTRADSCLAVVAAQNYRPTVQIDQSTGDWVGTTDSVPSPTASSGIHAGPRECASIVARNLEAAKSGLGRLGGRERLQAGLAQALGKLKKAPHLRKLILVVAPANEVHTKLDTRRLIRQALNSGIPVHAIYLDIGRQNGPAAFAGLDIGRQNGPTAAFAGLDIGRQNGPTAAFAGYLEALSSGIERDRKKLEEIVTGTGGSFRVVNDVQEGYVAAQEVLSRTKKQCVVRGKIPDAAKVHQITFAPVDPGVRIRAMAGESTPRFR